MEKIMWFSVLVGFSVLVSPTPTLAISVDLVPSSVTVVASDSFTVAGVISGLVAGGPPSVGAFDLTVSFNPAILSPTGVTFGLFLGNPGLGEALTDFNFATGSVEFAEVSLFSPAALDARQPASFTLATLSFTALASGTTTLAFSEIIVDDAFGNKLLPVPEPTSLWLLVSGLMGLGVIAWRQYRRPCRRHRHAEIIIDMRKDLWSLPINLWVNLAAYESESRKRR